MITKKTMLAALLAAPAALAFAAPASAQVSGIAYASPTQVVGASKAFQAANQQIGTTYKAQFDQVNTRRTALQKEMEPLLKQLDTNNDQQISDAEIQAATNAKNPALDKLRTAQNNANTEIQRLTNPAARAELFAIESILKQYEAAQLRVVNARKISVVLSPEVFMYAPDSADISTAWRALSLSFCRSAIFRSSCVWVSFCWAMTLAACSFSRRCWSCASVMACSSWIFGSAFSLNFWFAPAVR